MDEVKIVTGFTRGIISKIIRTLIRKKTGVDPNIILNNIEISVCEGKTHVHLDVDAELSKEELTKILGILGLN